MVLYVIDYNPGTDKTFERELMEQWLLVAGVAAICIFMLGALFRKNKLWSYFSFAGCLLIMAVLLLRWYSSGRPPWAMLYETSALLALITMLAAAYLYRKGDEPLVYLPLSGLAIILLAFSALSWEDNPALPASLNSGWLLIHVPVVITAYGLFAVSFVSAAALVALKIKNRGDEGAITRLDSVSFAAAAMGFVLLAAGIVMGAIWAKAAWGAYWSWDPKETWSLITAIIYAVYLLSRSAGIKGEDAAFVSMLGFVAVLFTYLGVSYLIPGLHSYA
jgi:cytochrome c-type biogenesis protein CcsB